MILEMTRDKEGAKLRRVLVWKSHPYLQNNMDWTAEEILCKLQGAKTEEASLSGHNRWRGRKMSCSFLRR